MPQSTLDLNLASLAAASGVELSRNEVLHARVEPAAPWWLAEIQASNGAWLRLHSTRDPMREARAQVAATVRETSRTIVLLGGGLGYVAEALLESPRELHVIVIEPSPVLARACLSRRDWRRWIDTGRFELRCWPEIDAANPLWKRFDRDEADPVIVPHPVIAREHPDLTAQMHATLARTIFDGRANADARNRQAGVYLLNTVRNLGAITASADVAALTGVFRGLPMVIVGAGPSLDQHLDILRDVERRAVVIAVDTALRPLANAGVRPHLAVALDPTELNARHLTDLPDAADTWLVAEPSVAPHALMPFANRLFTFRVSDHHPWPWLDEQGLTRGLLTVWGSVLTAALDLALATGADPIVFAGSDLAFSGGRPYCRGASWEDNWALQSGRGVPLESQWKADLGGRPTETLSDLRGNSVRTTPHLIAFRDWLLRRMADAPGRRFVNVSGDGILFGGRVELAPLDPLLLGFPGAGQIARERVRQIGHDAVQRQSDRRRDLSKAVTLVIDAHQSPVRNAWLAFGRATMTGDDLDHALRVAVDTLSTPLDLAHDMPHAPSGLLPAADRAFLLRHALIASDEDVVAVQPTDASTVALHSAVQRLTRLATLDDRCEKPQPTTAVLRAEAGRVPVSLLFNWPRDVRHEIARLEDDLARAIEPALRGVALGPAEYTTAQALETRDPFTLLAHSWLSAARYSSDHRLLDSPATVRWILEALLVEPRDAERAEEPSLEIRLDGRTALPLSVPVQRPATALTGLLCVADATGREWRPQVAVRRSGGAERTGASWLRLFEGPALRCAMTAPPQWALEQCPSWTAVAHADGWNAEAFPDANVVRITSPDTRVAWLGVVAAESVAWTGESLLVTSMGPELRSFENVRRRIEESGE